MQQGKTVRLLSIGNNCFIATGAKVIGDIHLGNDIAIGANAVVTKSFIEDGITLGGTQENQQSYIKRFSRRCVV